MIYQVIIITNGIDYFGAKRDSGGQTLGQVSANFAESLRSSGNFSYKLADGSYLLLHNGSLSNAAFNIVEIEGSRKEGR